MRLLKIIIFLFISCDLFAQGNSILVLEGFYTGKPLYFEYDNSYGGCVVSCRINNQYIDVAIYNNQSKIDPGLIDYPKNTLITLFVQHKSNCTPVFLNPDDFRKEPNKLEKLYDTNKHLIFEGELKNKKYYTGKYYIYKNYSVSEIVNYKNGIIKDTFKVEVKEILEPKQSTINHVEKFKEFIQYKPIKFEKIISDVNVLKKQLASRNYNSFDKDSNLTGLWIITKKNIDFINYKQRQGNDFYNDEKIRYAVENGIITKNQIEQFKLNLEEPEKTIITFDLTDLSLKTSYRKSKLIKVNYSTEIDSIIEVGYFWHSIKIGKWTTFKNEFKRSDVIYDFGKINGVFKSYYENGKIEEFGYWYGNSYSGTFKRYYPSGQLAQEKTFSSIGKSEGISIYYYENGIIELIYNAKDGIETGSILRYNPDGTLLEANYCKDGNCDTVSSISDNDFEFHAMNDFVIEHNNDVKRQKQLLVKEKDLKISKLNEEAQKAKGQTQKIIIVVGIIGLAIIAIFLFIVFKRYRIEKSQKITIQKQKSESDYQKHIIEEKHKEITDSINYAQRLQQAILAPKSEIDKYIANNFLLYIPKDIVAGDFYFFEVTDDFIFYAAADCTGHGVPGAMVSIVCSNALTRSVKEFGYTNPGEILDRTRELILDTFKKSGEDIKDGMDISLISINRKNNEIKWSGANNSLWYIENGEMKEIKPDKQPIGKTETPKPFTTHLLPSSLTSLFLFTDGFADQFGGPKGKKFKYSNLQKLLLENSNEKLEIINTKLEIEFKNWKGDLEQVDDVCIIGIKI